MIKLNFLFEAQISMNAKLFIQCISSSRAKRFIAALTLCIAISRTPAASAVIAPVTCHLQQIESIKVFYREAGTTNLPTLLLLHGFPSSSFYFRNLMPLLGRKYHVIAPDYPGFGSSDTPAVDKFVYT